MKMSLVFTLFGFLALCCCCLGVASQGPSKDECAQYPKPAKGNMAVCPRTYFPVCGSDGKTYDNTCSFCAAKRNNSKLTIKHEGECEQKDECAQYPDKGKSGVCPRTYFPVCGSDGKTYENTCLFCEARWRNSKLTIKHEGECTLQDLCDQHPDHKAGVCFRTYFPVCGSDGQTYDNTCFFCEARWKNSKLTIKHEGECTLQDLCDQYPDHKSGVCFRISDPVCGSDGQTYDNKCLFCEARWKNSKLTIKHEDECTLQDICDQYPDKGKSGVCERIYIPVCGSDGKTYDQCLFCAANWNNSKLTIKHRGECEQKMTPLDECAQYPKPAKGNMAACSTMYLPVCGSDGKTYDNKCLFCAAKWNNSKLTIKHEGECEQKDECAQYPEPAKGNVAVCSRMCSPVCGSDGQTYDTRCHFCAAKWKNSKLTIKQENRCEQKGQ